MSRLQKLRDDFNRRPPPKDFSWEDLVRLLRSYGYSEHEGSGSRKRFVSATKHKISLHKRHPDDTLLEYQIELVKEALISQGHMK
jgi:hypothetical protein